jgi:prepilin-type N-terminal cleavage/methylation domain-containing protein
VNRALAGKGGDRRGMTLVEMMVALALFAVVMSVIATFLFNSRRSYASMSGRVETQQSMRAVLILMSREIRSAGCDPAQVGIDRFPLAEDNRLRCRMDLDGDGLLAVAEPAEDVTYQFLPGTGQLVRDPGTGPQVLLQNVTGLTFRYFDGDGNLLGPGPLSAMDRQSVRLVEVDLAAISDRDEPVRYNTRILVRNG